MTDMKKTIGFCLLFSALSACGQNAPTATKSEVAQSSSSTTNITQDKNKDKSDATLLVWEDLMPEGEEALLEELYSEFYEDMEAKMRQQMTLVDAAREENKSVTDVISEGSAQDTMDQIGTYNVVDSLNGEKIRIPGYIVPLDFSAKSEHTEFLLVPYFGACLHTPPPPPNQIVFVTADPAAKISNINEPVWLEGTMKTGKFASELGNSAYELSLSKLEPYEY